MALVDEKAKQNKAHVAAELNQVLEKQVTTQQEETKTTLDALTEQNQLLNERMMLLEQTSSSHKSSNIEKRLDSLEAKFDTLSNKFESLSANFEKLTFAFLVHDQPRDTSKHE